jgi:hypothetical protein
MQWRPAKRHDAGLWPEAAQINVCYLVVSGLIVITLSPSPFDPQQTPDGLMYCSQLSVRANSGL